jgi:hypothetical protein
VLRWTGGRIVGEVTAGADTQVTIRGPDPKELYRSVGATGPAGGTLKLAGTTTLSGPGMLSLTGASPRLQNRGTLTVTGPGPASVSASTGSIVINAAGRFVVNTETTIANAEFRNRGHVEVAADLSLSGISGALAYDQQEGRTDLVGGDVDANGVIRLQKGSLRGTGDVQTSLLTSRAIVSPGKPETLDAGTLHVTGEFTQHDEGLLRMDVKTREEHDQIAVTGKARVAGRLNVRNAQQFSPRPSDQLPLLSAGDLAVTSTFAGVTHDPLPVPRDLMAWTTTRRILLVNARKPGGPAGPDSACSARQSAQIRAALAVAFTSLRRTVSSVQQPDPVTDAELLRFFGPSATADRPAIALRFARILAGLRSAPVECEDDDSVLCSDIAGDGTTLAYVILPAQTIHACQPRLARETDLERLQTMVHEGAHAFLRLTRLTDVYYGSGCADTQKTLALTDAQRRKQPDAYACLVRLLNDR